MFKLSFTTLLGAVVAAIAKREKADFIISMNESDFENSHVPAISPTQFINKFFPEFHA